MILSIRGVLEKTPPELASDIIDRGIVLTGGSAKLHRLDDFLSKNIGVPVIIAPEPLTCVAQGIEIALGNLEDYKKSLFSNQ